MSYTKGALKAGNDAELLSYIINVTPELAEDIDLPVQGESIKPIGQIIVSNERYKNAFLNTINLIGLTVIDRVSWENPWRAFTDRGRLNFGQSVRELFVEMAKVYDYHADLDKPAHFLNNVVPDVYNYLHELNFQKYYKTTTSDEEIAMAFNEEGQLMDLIEKIVRSLYTAYEYDRYIVSKYMLCRRILDGTVTSVEIDGYGSLNPRERVAAMKNVSNMMTFLSPKYNPAGVHVASKFEDQILIMNTDFQADYDTSVLATSYFMNEAQFKTNYALVDGFGSHDTARLAEVLGDQYVEFSSDDLAALANIPCVIIDRNWFQVYTYSLDNAADPSGDGARRTNFFNPETLRNNLWLHSWAVYSTSPFMNAVVFTKDVTPNVTNVAVSPSTAVVTPGQSLKLSATVTATGFANKAVQWSVTTSTEGAKATIRQDGTLTIDADTPGQASFTVTAKSVYKPTVYGTATVTTPAEES